MAKPNLISYLSLRTLSSFAFISHPSEPQMPTTRPERKQNGLELEPTSHTVYIILFCMFNHSKQDELHNNLTTVLRRNFTSSPNLEILVARPMFFPPCPVALPRVFLATGLQQVDAKTLTHYQIWFTKETQFCAFDTLIHNSDFIGHFRDLLGPKDADKVAEAFITGFREISSEVNKFLRCNNIPLDEIIASLRLTPLEMKEAGCLSYQWRLYAPSPYPGDQSLHLEWLQAIRQTTFATPLTGEGRYVSKEGPCLICRGCDHSQDDCIIPKIPGFVDPRFTIQDLLYSEKRSSARAFVGPVIRGCCGGC